MLNQQIIGNWGLSMMLSNSEIIIVIASAFILGAVSTLLINTDQLLRLLKKTISQAKDSKNAKQKITDLKKENEKGNSELVESNVKLSRKVTVLESEADGEDPLASPVSDASYPLSEIDGIGKGYSVRLSDEGYMDSTDLAKINGDSEKIEAISKTLGLENSEVSSWCSMAELMRVDGIRGPFAFLLKAVGVESLKDLSQCNSEQLSKQLALENVDESKTPTVPSPVTIESWIDESRKMVNS